MRAFVLFASCVLPALSGCGLSALRGGGEGGPPPVDAARAVFRVWHDRGVWYVRGAPAGGAHRFQGSVEGLTGGLDDPDPEPSALRDRVARQRNTVQFDFEADRDEVGFDVRSTGGCLRFDLYLDGRRRADRVRYGARGQVPDRLPAVLCP